MQIILKILIIYYVIGLAISLKYSMSPKYREKYLNEYTTFEIIAGILIAAIVTPAMIVIAFVKTLHEYEKEVKKDD